VTFLSQPIYIRSGTIFKTTNSGAVWQQLSSGVSQNLFAISFLNVNTGTAVGASGVIIRTTNGGAQWVAQQSNVTGNLGGVNFINNDLGFVAGYNSSNNSSVI
jgi:photosystem II stability/assembly factor-like uncharacterized protein